ncbi:MAG: Omp28-related outer membrane protein [Flavobacteriales bacterium]|nr:Omp28-related outer membrane protein [Flavobacteriales bacterium]
MSSRQILLLALVSIVTVLFHGCDAISPPHYGCIDPNATNYNPDATHADGPCQGKCEYDTTVTLGCTDQSALNYNPSATANNCACIYAGQRNVLVEDYTGHTCGNCPRAAEVLHDLQLTYGSRVIPMAVHVGFFAAVQNNPDGSYATDFRTPAGNAWNTTFGSDAQGLPNGLINRRPHDGSYPYTYTAWTAEVANLLELDPDASLTLDNTYDPTSRTLNTSIEVSIFNDLNSGPYNIIVCLTEDSVIDWQKDYDPALEDESLPDYVHMHVLRTNFNGPWGDQIGTGNLAAGSVFTVNYSLELNPEWVAKNCKVVAFVHRTDTKEVVQADFKAILEE